MGARHGYETVRAKDAVIGLFKLVDVIRVPDQEDGSWKYEMMQGREVRHRTSFC